MDIGRGQRIKLSELIRGANRFSVELAITSPLNIDISCFGLDTAGKLSDDRYMTFFNQPRTPCGSVALEAGSGGATAFAFDLDRLPATIDRLVLAAAIDGQGTMSQIDTGFVRFLVSGNLLATFPFRGGDFAGERALILGEFYRKEGLWRFSATAQGFNGGLDALVSYFGGTVEAPASAPAPKSGVSLEKKIAAGAPQLVSLAKKAAVSLEKQKLVDVVAKVGVVLDASGSMLNQYRGGSVQELIERVLPLAVHFDDDGELDTWAFAERSVELAPITMNNIRGYVEREEGGWMYWMKRLNAGINYEPAVIRDVIAKYKDAGPGVPPAYVIFLSDGGVGSDREIESLLREASRLPIFWQFIGIGGSSYGVLERFDSMKGRFVDNCNFFALDDLHSIDEGTLYDRLLNEFPSWLKEVRSKGILR